MYARVYTVSNINANNSYRVRVGKSNEPGHRDIHVPHDISFTPWYLICRKPGCRFVGMVRVLNDSTRLGFTTTDGRGNIIMNLVMNL